MVTEADQVRRILGYMPDFFGVYDDMKVIEYLEFFAAAYRIKGEARRKRCNEMLEIVDLDFKRDAYANTLSRGQTQRLGLARVLLHDPQVLLLDEPFAGIDPISVGDIQEIIYQLRDKGIGILITDHNYREMLDTCNHSYVLSAGKIIAQGGKDEILANEEVKKVYLGETVGG